MPPIGSEVFFMPGNRGGHGAFITVEKHNRVTFEGTELPRSYSKGTKWRLHSIKNAFQIVDRSSGFWRGVWYNDNP